LVADKKTYKKMDRPLPPLPPINNNKVGSVNVAVELFDLVNSPSTITESVADDFFALLSARAVDCKMDFLVKEAPTAMEKIRVSPGQIYLYHIKWACFWMM